MSDAHLHALEPDDIAGWQQRPHHEQCALNLAALDRHVLGWDAITAERPPGQRTKLPLIFLHVPKTGGTTLTGLIERNYSSRRVTHVNAPDLYQQPQALAAITGQLTARARPSQQRFVVMGHHALNDVLYQLPSAPFAHVTMLRDPIRRVLSHYNHVTQDEGHISHAKATARGLADYVAERAQPETQDGQVLRLAGYRRRRELAPVTDRRVLLELAKQSLERRFSFFGVTERFDAFLILCQRLLGWPEIFYTRRNVRSTGVELPPPEVLDVVREHNRLDLELHAWATELFDARCAALGIDAAVVERFADANRRYNELVGEQY